MKKKISRAVSFLLALTLICGALITSVSAVTPVDEATELAVYIRTKNASGDNVDTLLHTYTAAEMESLAVGGTVNFTTIDNMPATVKTVVTKGVYLDTLINNAAQYTSLSVWDFTWLRFTATDSASGRFSYADLFGTTRYYYAALHEAGGGVNGDGEISCDPGTGVAVKPMLAITSTQQRLPSPVLEPSSPYYPEKYAMVFGVSDSELENVTSRLSDCKRGVNKITIDMGSTVLPEDVPVTGVRLDHTAETLAIGERLQLTAEIYPDNATDKTVTWSSSNAAVAAVSDAGMVTVLTEGTATITVTSADNPAKSFSCVITVGSGSVPVASVTLERDTLSLALGGTKTLTATVLPADSTERTVLWTSSDEAVVTVNTAGKLTAVAVGSATVTASCGGVSASCAVTVEAGAIAVTGVTLSQSAINIKKGSSHKLTATVLPQNATNTDVMWSTDAPGIAAVGTDGTVTTKNLGTATITVATDDGRYTAKCVVTVTSGTFTDTGSSWAKDNIEKMAGLGFINGYSDGTFRPQGTITRAEFVTMLMRVIESVKGAVPSGAAAFDDTAGHWAESYISSAVALGVVGGYGDGRFGPNDLVTRQQIAVMLAKAAGFDGSDGEPDFTDGADIAPWAKNQVAFTASEGFFRGYDDGTFRPLNNATRAEAATLLLRFYEYLGGRA